MKNVAPRVASRPALGIRIKNALPAPEIYTTEHDSVLLRLFSWGDKSITVLQVAQRQTDNRLTVLKIFVG